MLDPHEMMIAVRDFLFARGIVSKEAICSPDQWTPVLEALIREHLKDSMDTFFLFVEWWAKKAHYEHRHVHPQPRWQNCDSNICSSLRQTIEDLQKSNALQIKND